MEYEQIFVRTRAALDGQRPGLLPRWLRDPQRLTRLARIGAALRAGRWLPAFARFLPIGSLGRRLAQTQPDLPPRSPFRRLARIVGDQRERVVLFRGCVASVYDADSLAAGRVLLEALGHEVVEVAGTRCCGALPRHAGDVDRGRLEARATRDALCATGSDVVLVSASGCHGDLRDEVAVGTALKVTDILAFIAASSALHTLAFKPLALRAALHLPCTQVNVVGQVAPIRALLARIPQLVVLALPEQPRCCGAAGSYFLEYPDIADRLRAEQLDQAQALEPDLLLTTNIGCRIHLGNGLRERTVAIPVMHPLALLAQQLDTPDP
ncbi:(Fe-S)-binding protein [Dokdonella sp.]|uniref:(Fe-S)-binding protein n=1 Tax=Dokdonella sp. TaxID=2291710 RepID=UPI00326668EE